MHVAPSEGTPRDVAGPVIEGLFPKNTPTRIPVAAITGTNGKTTTSRMLAHILKFSGYTVGLTSTDGVYIDGKLSVEGDMTGPVSARMVLRDPFIDAAVMETARGGLLRGGLGYAKCNVACCLNVSADHLGLRGINTLEQLAEIKRVPIEVATDAAVLNADDPLCLQMADYSEAKKICYVTMNASHPLVKQHILAGGQAFVLEQGMNGHMITIYDGDNHIPLLWTHLIPATIEGKAMHNVQNAMFAAALAFNMNVNLDNIRQGLRTFDTTFFQAPGRMNIYNEHDFKVILDYAHNPAAVKAMCNLVDQFNPDGKRIVLLAAPGDRRDEDMQEIARIAAPHFDHFVCRRDDGLRGRQGDEVPLILKRALMDAGVEEQRIEIVNEEEAAVEHAMRISAPGDLLLILGDNISRCWKQIIYFNSENKESQTRSQESSRPELPGEQDFEIDMDYEIVQDERGVRIVREAGD
jgi:cyanophycin synthetase